MSSSEGVGTPLRVGVNALYLLPGKVGGTEIYLRNLLRALAEADGTNQYLVFRNRETGRDLTPERPNFRDCPQPVTASSRAERILYEQMALPVVAARNHLGVLFNAGFTAPLLCPCPMVTVFHDFQYKRHPEFFRWFDLPFWQLLLPASAARSSRIVTLSQAVKADVELFYRFPAAAIDVIPHGVESEFSEIAGRRAGAGYAAEKMVLSVSTLHPHKNLDALLSAWARFRGAAEGWKLYLVGLKGFEAQRIEARRRDLRLENSVVITGWVPRVELYGFFERTAAFVYPSRFEGFGIPVLEALAAGIPTACSRLPSLEEIAGDAALFFDPSQPDEMLQALERIVSDEELRGRLRMAGRARARQFSWRNAAERMIACFRSAAQPAMRSKNAQDARATRSQR